MHEQGVRVEPPERVAALRPHAGELRAHGELSDLSVRRTRLTCRVRLVLAPLRVCAPRLRVAEIVTQAAAG